jgi:DNA mismatch repair protein MutL
MSGSIHLLAPEIADAIAAGEVIERPASVVKELVENALDGEARRINIDVRGAGRTSIRVSDDGAGIAPDELALAFVRHATSKVAKLSDLVAIVSFGFRGEALASIAAVADVACSSGGSTIRVRAGELAEQGSGPLLPGVTIEVRDLFANVPARLKFLKSDATEVAAIKDIVSAFALLHPHVRFHLTIDARVAVSTTGDGDRRRAIAAVFGAAVAAEVLELVGMPLVTGAVSQPRLSRGSRDGIVLAVNGRPISARALVYALEECYLGRLERGRHPVAVIDIGIDPELVDVNVHPAKKEIRFRDEGTVFAALQRAVRAALDGSEPFRYRPAESVPGTSCPSCRFTRRQGLSRRLSRSSLPRSRRWHCARSDRPVPATWWLRAHTAWSWSTSMPRTSASSTTGCSSDCAQDAA